MSEQSLKDQVRAGLSDREDAQWAQFESSGIELLIRPITSKEFNSLGRRSTKVKYHRHQRQDDVDPLKLNDLLIARCVLDWRGMTGRRFCKLAHVKPEVVAKVFGITEDQLTEAQVPFSVDAAQVFGEQCFGFWSFVYETATSMGGEVEEEEKN